MKETDWVDSVAARLRDVNALGPELRIETQFRLPYGNEMREFGDNPIVEATEYATDMIILEDVPGGNWRPRVVVEAKVGTITAHGAITYSQKAADHKRVCPYLRYGFMMGNRGEYPLPGRLYRHGANFDFMVSFKQHDLASSELQQFAALLVDEVAASRALETIMYDTRRRDRAHYTVLHRKLLLDHSDT